MPHHRSPRAILIGLALAAGSLGVRAADAASPQAFDAALATAMSEGMGTTPAEWSTAVADLRATLPVDDERRRRRFEAIACWAQVATQPASIARARDLVAAEAAASSPDPLAAALASACVGAMLPLSPDIEAVQRQYDDAIAKARDAGEPRLVGSLLVSRSSVHSVTGDFARALVDGLEAQKHLEMAGDRFAVVANLQNIGTAYRRMGDHANAERLLRDTLQDPEMQKRWAYRLTGHLQLGYLYDESGRPAEAREAFAQAIAIAEAHDSHVDLGYARLGLAGALVSLRRPRAALAALDAARRDFATGGDPGDPAMADMIAGQALAASGKVDDGLAALDRAIDTWIRERNDRYLVLALPARARVLESQGRFAEANRDLQRYIEAQAADGRRRAEQRTELFREQFEASRRELENAELRSREALRDQEIAGLTEARRWQWLAMVLGGVLVLLLTVLVMRQFARTRRLQRLAATDALTGLPNRRQVEERGRSLLREAEAGGTTFCLLVLDLDHFKPINDRYGHPCGDAVLARVARACQAQMRRNDLFGRTGGEEFIGLLADTGLDGGRAIAERLRAAVAALDLRDLAPDLAVTCSIGLTERRANDPVFPALVARADLALYRAKQAGRNRVVADSDPTGEATP